MQSPGDITYNKNKSNKSKVCDMLVYLMVIKERRCAAHQLECYVRMCIVDVETREVLVKRIKELMRSFIMLMSRL